MGHGDLDRWDGGRLTVAGLAGDEHGILRDAGNPLLRGRLLTPADRLGAPHVAVVNQAFSRQYLNGGDPIGRRFRRGPNAPWFEIVGLVNDVRRGGKTKDIRPQIYLPAAQTDGYPVRLADFAVRTAGDPRQLVKAIQQQVWALDKDQPVTGVRTMEELISLSVAEQRFQMLLLALFAGVAVALAVIGIFGVLSYGVNQRMNELGIRVALGASPRKILGLVLGQAGVLIAAASCWDWRGRWHSPAWWRIYCSTCRRTIGRLMPRRSRCWPRPAWRRP